MSALPQPGAFGPLPLVVWVTGHRDLRDGDRAGLTDQVRGIFADLRRRYPATPLLLLDPERERVAEAVALTSGK